MNGPSASTAYKLRFVVQEQKAKTHHFDLRLEKDGVFKSWAVPKGLPVLVGQKRLAVQVEDHSLEWGDFEGVIPAGQRGAGTVCILDRGWYDLEEWLPDRISFNLHGERFRGRYQLVLFKQAARNHWLILKRRDQAPRA